MGGYERWQEPHVADGRNDLSPARESSFSGIEPDARLDSPVRSARKSLTPCMEVAGEDEMSRRGSMASDETGRRQSMASDEMSASPKSRRQSMASDLESEALMTQLCCLADLKTRGLLNEV